MLIAIALFDRFTALDGVGPFQVLVQLPGAKTIFVAERPREVTDQSGSGLGAAWHLRGRAGCHRFARRH